VGCAADKLEISVYDGNDAPGKPALKS